MPDTESNLFEELEIEISEATAKSRLKGDAALLSKQAHNTRLSERYRAEAREQLKSLQLILEANKWEATRGGALFAEQTCDGCGSVHYNFLQFMQEEVLVHNRTSKRWTRVAVPPIHLERETIIQPLSTHICSDCSEDHGFNVSMPNIRLLPKENSLTVSPTYIQGDINGTSEEN